MEHTPEPHEEEDDFGLPLDEEFDDDLPCIRCQYNLRGLKPEGRCPECGTEIQKSLDYAMERILCLACMKPNHPSAAVCSGCRTPLHTAGATGAYFQTQARGVRRKRGEELDPEVEAELAKLEARKKPKHVQRPNPVGIVVMALVIVPVALMFVRFGIKSFDEADVAGGSMCMVIALVVVAMILLPIVKYARQRDAYLQYRARKLKEREDSAEAKTTGQP